VQSVGDEILEVNGDSLQGLTHQKAIQTFKVNVAEYLAHFLDYGSCSLH
jgi:hypothetical protein